MNATIAAIYRYPVKGLSAEGLGEVQLEPGRAIAQDRRFAITTSAGTLQAAQASWQPKTAFRTLMQDERLARLAVSFDETEGLLTISREGKAVARGKPNEPAGRAVIEQFLDAFLGGTARFLEADGFSFSNVPDALISLVNLASVADLKRVAGRDVDPMRFRANLLIKGLEPWTEMQWVGRGLKIGDARLRVVQSITRCAATEVNPQTAERDLPMLRILQSGFRHTLMGVYAQVDRGGRIAPGDQILVE